MIYKILRFFAGITIIAFFRKIYWINENNIPKTGPVLIACNHPMAFTEACIAACFFPRSIHFLVRGDVFVKKWMWFFKATNQIPIYRFRDGFQNLRKNAKSFEQVDHQLVKNQAIILFPEGNTVFQKRLSPLQKGLGRMALNALIEHEINDLLILPMGVTYSDGLSFHSDVYVNFHQPIPVKEWKQQYLEDSKMAIRDLTKVVEDRMKQLLVHIEESVDQEMAQNGLSKLDHYQRGGWLFGKSKDSKPLSKRQEWISNLTHNKATNPELHDEGGKFNKMGNRLNLIWFVLLSPLALLGYILNAVPFYLAKFIANSRVKLVEFVTAVRLGTWMLLQFIYLLILFLVFLFWMNLVIALFAVLLMVVLGFLTKAWFEFWVRHKMSA